MTSLRSQFFAALLLAAVVIAVPVAATAAGPEVGDPAPEFELQGSDGNTYTLAGMLAEGHGVVLAWFPKAFTPG